MPCAPRRTLCGKFGRLPSDVQPGLFSRLFALLVEVGAAASRRAHTDVMSRVTVSICELARACDAEYFARIVEVLYGEVGALALRSWQTLLVDGGGYRADVGLGRVRAAADMLGVLYRYMAFFLWINYTVYN